MTLHTAKIDVSLSRLYQQGEGTKKNLKLEKFWLKKALTIYQYNADRGSAKAQLALGLAYYTGTGTKKSNKKPGFGWKNRPKMAML